MLHPAVKTVLNHSAPWLFVLIWATGFNVARAIVPHADPNLFLTARFALCTLLFAAIATALSIPWPTALTLLRLLGIGALLQGLYLGLAFWAVGNGMPAGSMALFGALQPPLTALVASRYLKETIAFHNWFGLLLGVTGVAMVISPDIVSENSTQALHAVVILAAIASVLSITAGTLLQKSAVASVHLVTSSAVQNAGACATVLILALLLQEHRFSINVESIAILVYAVIVLSAGGTTLLLWMVRNGSTTRTTSLLFLAPPLAAIMAWWLFDQRLNWIQAGGFIIALTGVVLARR